MDVRIEMPVAIYDGFIEQCDRASREYAILKNGLIFRPPKGEHFEPFVRIECTTADVKNLVALAAKVYPAAVADIARGITRPH
jgi:hypothetical protein